MAAREWVLVSSFPRKVNIYSMKSGQDLKSTNRWVGFTQASFSSYSAFPPHTLLSQGELSVHAATGLDTGVGL